MTMAAVLKTAPIIEGQEQSFAEIAGNTSADDYTRVRDNGFNRERLGGIVEQPCCHGIEARRQKPLIADRCKSSRAASALSEQVDACAELDCNSGRDGRFWPSVSRPCFRRLVF